MLVCMGSNVYAAAATASGCARPADMNALRTAAMQQRLMVAALSCGESQSYNQFVRSYQPELQASDKNLQAYFRRVNGKMTFRTLCQKPAPSTMATFPGRRVAQRSR